MLIDAWKNAGSPVDIHRGMRTSGGFQGIVENGLTLEEIQQYGQWASMQTVKDHYAEYDLGRLRMIQERIGGAK